MNSSTGRTSRQIHMDSSMDKISRGIRISNMIASGREIRISSMTGRRSTVSISRRGRARTAMDSASLLWCLAFCH